MNHGHVLKMKRGSVGEGRSEIGSPCLTKSSSWSMIERMFVTYNRGTGRSETGAGTSEHAGVDLSD
jgi:hypothetical protein